MEYKKFSEIFNKTIFEKSKPDLIKKFAKNPERYTGLFRPTKSKTKIIQNLLQSHEIRFGDAFETLIEEYLRELGFTILDKKFNIDNNKLNLDQLFSKDKCIFFIEQKIRDDHDSTKKRGQIDNFEKKIGVILERHQNLKIEGFFYFIDDSFSKNKNFYAKQIDNLSTAYGIPLNLVYGNELFQKLRGINIWQEILKYLAQWHKTIPDLPEINFDKNPQESFAEIKHLETIVYRKLFSNLDLDDLFRILFPQQETLKLLNKKFEQMYQNGEGKIYQTLNMLCMQTIKRLRKEN